MIETKKVCFLGMPSAGGISPHAAAGFWTARADPETIHRSFQESSLLDSNCSALWCHAINLVRSGKREIAYWAMLHSDVQPEPFWLDKLIEEMESEDLDVLSVVVPIKDEHGLTSTALGEPDLDDFWRCHCRLTMREVYSLPETFTAAACGHPDRPLLVNTGCFVCRFELKHAIHMEFASHTRIVFDEKTDRYIVENEPEDWHFSRDCHRAGLRVGATRKIALSHRGLRDHGNTEPWGGYDFDRYYLSEASIQPVESSDWRFPWDVEGWLSLSEGQALAELASDKHVLEVGSYCGRSTICMAQTARSVIAVDTFDGRATPKPGSTLSRFDANVRRYGVADRVVAFEGTLDDYIRRRIRGSFDFAFIDGAHDYDQVRSDIENVLPLLKPDGLLAFHDYRESPGEHDGRWDPGVTRAVNELLAMGAELLSRHNTVAVVRPAPALVEV